MPHFVVDKVQNALNDHAKPVRGSHVHMLGMAYKRDIDDVRESPALDIICCSKQRGAKVTLQRSVRAENSPGRGRDLDAQDASRRSAAAADCVVIVTDHSASITQRSWSTAKLIVDTRNALKGFRSPTNRAAMSRCLPAIAFHAHLRKTVAQGVSSKPQRPRGLALVSIGPA